jgi:anti-sigma factor RsiW
MSVTCEIAAPFVANSAVEGRVVARPLRGHIETCLRCQARHTAMVRTARELRDLAMERSEAPADLEWRVMSSLEGELAIPRSWRRPVAVIAAVVSMAAAVVIWRLRPRTSG